MMTRPLLPALISGLMMMMATCLAAPTPAPPEGEHDINFVLNNLTALWEEVEQLRHHVMYHRHGDPPHDQVVSDVETMKHELVVHHLQRPHEGHNDHHDPDLLQHFEHFHEHHHDDHNHHDYRARRAGHHHHGNHDHSNDAHDHEGHDHSQDHQHHGGHDGHHHHGEDHDHSGDTHNHEGHDHSQDHQHHDSHHHHGEDHDHSGDTHNHEGHDHSGDDHDHEDQSGEDDDSAEDDHDHHHHRDGDHDRHSHGEGHDHSGDSHGHDGHDHSQDKHKHAHHTHHHHHHRKDAHDRHDLHTPPKGIALPRRPVMVGPALAPKYGLALIPGRRPPAAEEVEEWMHASCKVEPNADLVDGSVRGEVILSQKKDESGPVFFHIDLHGFKPSDGNIHGFHIHASAVTNQSCASAGGHFNPFQTTHGGPSAATRHVGDLGNIEVDSEGKLEDFILTDERVAFSGEASVISKSIVIHAGEDDLGLGGDQGSLTTGNAGGRLACCNIYMQPEVIYRFKG